MNLKVELATSRWAKLLLGAVGHWERQGLKLKI
jgi:hypothetical protein